MNSYTDWLNNAEAKKRAIGNLRKSGIPLELRAKKVFQDAGYSANTFRYWQADEGEPDDFPEAPRLEKGVWRELDIHAMRQENRSINVEGGQIGFATHFLVECKYSSERDLIAFPNPNSGNADLRRFPLLVNGHKLVPPSLASYFDIPTLVDRVVEIDINKDNKESGNLRDSAIHKASEQMLSAMESAVGQGRSFARNVYIALSKESTLKKKWDELSRQGKLPQDNYGYRTEVPKDFIRKFVIENFVPPEQLVEFGTFYIEFFFPVLVVDGNSGVIGAKLDAQYDITDLEDLRMCVYLYVSENANRFYNCLENTFTFPIIICNLTYLPQLIEKMIIGVDKIITRTELIAKKSPFLIPEEVLFNERIYKI